MKYRKLGRTDIEVSSICLGSMTWGTQNTEAEGHQQIDYAFDQGVNFIDTAEMYPVNPTSAETQGRTEEVIGTWLKASGKRDEAIIATKVAGEGVKWIRDGAAISPATITRAVEDSLKRLQTDYIDLYQLHWPNRGSYHFRQSWTFDPTKQNKENTRADIQACLECLNELIDAGKIRTIGLSNESCWGTSQFLQIAAEHNLPRVVSIQNEYSLLQRIYDLDL
ncbi:MAG: aldo/keto reductase, partial [Rhizobiales bacterium]|nr:aldo/keto reductase [Hyphomicrobiales bacterium]